MPGILGPIVEKQTVREYAQGAAMRAVQPVAEFLAPTVNVAGLTGFYSSYSSKHRFRVPNTLRGPRQRAVEIIGGGELVGYTLKPHALDYPVDDIDKLSAGDLENTVMQAADELSEVAGLAVEKETIDMALTAVGAGTDKTWNSSANPVKDIDAAIRTVLLAAGYGSGIDIGLLFGPGAFEVFKNQDKVASKFIAGSGNAKGGVALAVPTLENCGALFLGNPEVRQSYMVYDDAPDGKTQDMKFFLDYTVLVFARKKNPTRRDPSFMKTLRPRGQWMVPGSYMRDDGRVEVAKMDWHQMTVVGNAAAAVRLNISAG